MTRNESELPEAHEPSYYEIALTNRQVVGAFIVLLVCLLAAFVGGLWVGRESATREAETALRTAPPPAQVAETGDKTAKLDFFSVPQGSTQVEPGGKPGRGTLRQDLDKRDQTLGTPPVDVEPTAPENADTDTAPIAPISESAPPIPAPLPRELEKPAKLTAAELKEQQRKEKEAKRLAALAQNSQKPQKAERGDAEPPKGSFVVQVFSTSEKDQATKVKNRLVSGGEKAYLSPVKATQGTMYRVRIGPFTSRDAAQKVADKVRKGFKLDTWVTQ